jgi:serine/threonine protein kinase/ABC-type proline/glycine betaine transport system substrate-binding protein
VNNVVSFCFLVLSSVTYDFVKTPPVVARTLSRDGANTPLILESNPWSSHVVMTEIANILLSKRLGYTVTVKKEATTTSLNERLAGGSSMVNIEVWPDTLSSVPSNQLVGDNGLVGQKGMYTVKQEAQSLWNTDGHILSHWRSFTCSNDCTKLNSFVSTLKTGGMDSPGCTTCNLTPDTSSTGDIPACASADAGAISEAGCQQNGWYYPPNCASCATSGTCSCATLYGKEVGSDGTLLQNQLKALDMRVSIVWLGDHLASTIEAHATDPVLFYWWQPDNVFNNTKYTRLHLPNCQQGRSATDGHCDFAKKQLKIMAWPELSDAAESAVEFLDKMTITNSDVDSIFSIATNKSDDALKAAACTWVKANKDKIDSWIPPPPSCSQNDYNFSVSTCTGDERTVSFFWRYPTEGNAGVPANCLLDGEVRELPARFNTQCNLVAPDGLYGVMGLALTSLTVVLGLFALAFILLYRYHMCFDRSQPILMAAMICGCIALLMPGFLQMGDLSVFKCATADFLTQVAADFIIGCYIVKAQHFTRSYGSSITQEDKNRNDGDIHKKIHSNDGPKKKEDTTNKTAVLTADGRLVKEADLDAKEVKRQILKVTQWCLIEIIIFTLRMWLEPVKPMLSYYKAELPGTDQAIELDYLLCDQEGGSALYVLSWVYSAVLLAFAMYETLRAEKTGLVPDRYNMHALYNILLWAFVAVFYWTFGERTPGNVYSVNCTSQIMGAGMIIALLVAPRLRNWRFGASAKVQVLSSSYIITFEDLEIIHQIGEGSYGDVLAGRWKHTKVAIKRLRGQLSDEQMRAFGSEVGTMVELHHPNCVMLMGFCLQPPVLVMEFLGRGSLHQVLHVDKTIFDWTMQIHVLVDCARGMNFLHTHDPVVMHRDLKSPNVLVNDNWRCKIADFGLAQLKMTGAKDKEDHGMDAIGSLLWCAPEVLNNNPAMAPADVYAFAVMMFEVLYCELPFVNSELMSVPLKVCNGERPSSRKTPRAQTAMGEHFQTVTELMEKCWDADPNARPDFTTVLTTLESTAENLMGKHSWEQCVVYPANVKRSKEDAPKTIIDCLQEGDLELGFKIGEGAYGVVFEGIYLNKKVAVKQLFVDGVQDDVREEFHAEVNIMRAMEHPCLVKLLGVMEKMPKLLLVTELMLKGSLWDYYHREKRPSPHARHMALVLEQSIDMADGMEYLHEKKILHRDLKSQNIWLDENLKCKIGDFGMSRLNTNKTMTLCGSPLWCSPEILRSERYSFPADVFSFAIILWEAFHWAEPYTELTVMEIIIAVTQRNERPDISPMVPGPVEELIKNSWHAQPETRPLMGYALSKLQQFRTQVRVISIDSFVSEDVSHNALFLGQTQSRIIKPTSCLSELPF